MLRSWPSPCGGEEYAVEFNHQRGPCLLVLPAWFDESNKLRHFTVEVMRALDAQGVDSVLPDLPGCNESLEPLDQQDLHSWRDAAAQAAQALACTHVLAIRAAATIAPPLPGWSYAPVAATSALRALLRGRVIASKETGRVEKREELLETGLAQGLDLAGYRLGPAMIAQMAEADLPERADVEEIRQAELGGAGLWLRSEPDHDQQQAEALAARIAAGLRA
ncbi:hypothetical protein GCM10009127_21530 [Alteraurantiacibacter aestuarii]|uniref:hypothetical protein n=1 Tax=Alteraurantiacibacter aestuarii TaxID=650004 RepID=UPI0031DEA005